MLLHRFIGANSKGFSVKNPRTLLAFLCVAAPAAAMVIIGGSVFMGAFQDSCSDANPNIGVCVDALSKCHIGDDVKDGDHYAWIDAAKNCAVICFGAEAFTQAQQCLNQESISAVKSIATTDNQSTLGAGLFALGVVWAVMGCVYMVRRADQQQATTTAVGAERGEGGYVPPLPTAA